MGRPGTRSGRPDGLPNQHQPNDHQPNDHQHRREQWMTSSGRGDHSDADRGSLSLMLIVLAVALLALAGLVIDGGAQLDAASNAAAIAQEAARAGANQVNQQTAYSTGSFVVSADQARAAASQYLEAARTTISASGYQYTVQVLPPRTLKVTVTIREPTKMLSLIGINWITVHESATATLVTGVTGPGA